MKFISILFIVFLIFKAHSFAGPKVGNGGGAWICKTADGIEWIKQVDLFEAKREFNQQLIDFSDLNYMQIVEQQKRRLNEINYYYYYSFDSHLLNTLNVFKSVDSATLFQIDDVYARIKPDKESCLEGKIYYAQVANYTNDGRLLIQNKYWVLLSETEKASLIFHEAFYSLFRELYADQDSIRTRRVVGLVFSDISTDILLSKLEDEIFLASSPHFNPLDNEILPFILQSDVVQKYIEKSLNDYCLKNSEITCTDSIYFKLMNIKPGNGQMSGDIDDIKIYMPYFFTYQLRGTDYFCDFKITVLQTRKNGIFNKFIHNLQSKCSKGPEHNE